MKKLFLLSTIVVLFSLQSKAQVAINTDGSLPDPSALLDVLHMNKGVLIPRVRLMGTNDVITIPNAATSLLVYNTTGSGGANAVTPGFYYWDGNVWVRLTSSSGTGAAWTITGNAGTVDGTNFIGTTDEKPFNIRVDNEPSGRVDAVSFNSFWGYKAGKAMSTGTSNTAIGAYSLTLNTTGANNTGVGLGTLRNNISGNTNTAVGSAAMQDNTTGYLNTAMGFLAMKGNLTGFENTGIGVGSIGSNQDGYRNTAIGNQSLADNVTGHNNTAAGYNSLSTNISGDNNTANGSYALRFNTTGSSNTATGYYALYSNTTASNNTAYGFAALTDNTTGTRNTATGAYALNNNLTGNDNTSNGYFSMVTNSTGSNNTAMGRGALYSNFNGNNNTALGKDALVINTSGNDNVAAGNLALANNTTGDENIAIGNKSLQANTFGTNNTAVGHLALAATTGNANVAIGTKALWNTTSGLYNTSIGAYSLENNTTGDGITAIGYAADVSSGNLVNATALGANAIVNASHKVRIGSTNVTVIEGQVPFSFPSDKRFKYNIRNNVPGLDFVKKLQPVTYYFDEDKLNTFTKTGVIINRLYHPANNTGEKQLHTGFLAQDVEKIAKEMGYSFDGVHAPAGDKDHYSLAYSQFIMPLVKSVQEQQVIIEKQQSDIELLKMQVAELIKAQKNSTK